METLPLVSCIMPTYGRPDYVAESVAMFLAQDYPNKELIVLNDCAGQVFTGEFPDVRLINEPSRSRTIGEKRNRCVSMASGEVVAVWDDDDVYLPWRLSFTISEMQKFAALIGIQYEIIHAFVMERIRAKGKVKIFRG